MEYETADTGFPQHLADALHIARQANLAPARREIHQVVIAGLGGSGIGGTIVSELLLDRCRVPIVVNKGYSLRPSLIPAHWYSCPHTVAIRRKP